MATTRLRDRIFAGLGAVLFLVTASAFTIAVIYDNATKKDTTATQAQADSSTCSIESVASTDTLAAPDKFTVDQTVSELQTTDLTVGSGTAAKAGDCLQMKYYGTLAKDGTMFDENFTKSTALQFKLGAGQVIKGWDQGLVGIKEGGTRRVVIPASLGYGDQAQGSIPANSDLVFVVKLIKIKS